MKQLFVIFISFFIFFSVTTQCNEYKDLPQKLPNTDNNAFYHAKSTCNTVPKYGVHTSYNNTPTPTHYNATDFANHFHQDHYAEKDILSHHILYEYDEFIIFIKTLSSYNNYITKLYKKLKQINVFEKLTRSFTGKHYRGFTKRITALYKEIKQTKYDVHTEQLIINALNNCNNQRSFGRELNTIIQNIYANTSHHNIPIHTDIEEYLETSLDIIKNTPHHHELIFHTALVAHAACDISTIHKNKTFSTKHAPSNLFIRALEKFIIRLNPITQIKNTCDFLVHTAHFVADITLGKLYLTQEQYQLRKDDFWFTIDALSPSHLTLLTKEQIVDIAAECAADCVFSFGIFKAAQYIKNIQNACKANTQVSHVAKHFKNAFDSTLAEKPLLITPDGVIIKSTENMQAATAIAQEVIYDSKTLLESMQQGLLAHIEQELHELRNLFDNKIKGFGPCANKFIKIDYQHIFGIELHWSKKGKPQIKGFHHDYHGYIENTKLFDFTNKIFTKNAFYKSDLFFQGHSIKQNTSFFPAHWSREKIIHKIKEAYSHAIANKKIIATAHGNQIDGLIQEGILIRMHITNNGVIKSAYPLLE